MEELRYPVGKFDFSAEVADAQISDLVHQIEALPNLLKDSLEDLSEEQLNSPYRPGGWTIRQVVHHIADSHINSYIRFKLAATEECPTIKPYDENKWANLEDAANMPVDVSLRLIESLHQRWVYFLKSLTADQLNLTFRHPEIGEVSIKKAISLYAWHGNHHLGHINNYKLGLAIK